MVSNDIITEMQGRPDPVQAALEQVVGLSQLEIQATKNMRIFMTVFKVKIDLVKVHFILSRTCHVLRLKEQLSKETD